jgi:hypothetical protein
MAYVRRGLGFKVMNPNDPILQRPHWMNTTTTNDVLGLIENELDKMRRKEKKRQKKRESRRRRRQRQREQPRALFGVVMCS